jgi:hypothetical protein
LQFKSDLSKSKAADTNPDLFVQEYFFDKYDVSLTGVSAYTTHSLQTWRTVCS